MDDFGAEVRPSLQSLFRLAQLFMLRDYGWEDWKTLKRWDRSKEYSFINLTVAKLLIADRGDFGSFQLI